MVERGFIREEEYEEVLLRTHIEMSWPVDNLKGYQFVVHESCVRVQLLLDVIIGADETLRDKTDDHR